jgi:hypothetical protein
VESGNITDPPILTKVEDYSAPDGSINGSPDNEMHTNFSQYNTAFLVDEIGNGFEAGNTGGEIDNTTYNMGIDNTDEVSTSHILNDIVIKNDGTLHINGDKPLGYTGSGLPSPSDNTYFTAVTLGYCTNSDLTVQSSSTIEIGDGSNRTGRLLISEGSTLALDGKLKVNGNSEVVIEDGATLEVKANADIILNGSNAELVIRGDVQVMDNATFTFDGGSLGSGKVIFDYPDWPSDNITYGNNATFELEGARKNDVVLEIKQHDLYAWATSKGGPEQFKVTNGTILMHQGSRLFAATQFILKNVHVKHHQGLAEYDKQKSPRGIEIWHKGQVDIKSSTIEDMKKGVQVWLMKGNFTNNSGKLHIWNNDVKDCKYGIYTNGGGIDLFLNSLSNNHTGWKAEAMMYKSTFKGYATGNKDYGIDFHGSGGSVLRIEKNSTLSNNKVGVKMKEGNALEVFCSDITGNKYEGIKTWAANVRLAGPHIGYNKIKNNSTVVRHRSSRLLLDEGFNKFTYDILFEGYYWSTNGSSSNKLNATKNKWIPTPPQAYEIWEYFGGGNIYGKSPVKLIYKPTATNEELSCPVNDDIPPPFPPSNWEYSYPREGITQDSGPVMATGEYEGEPMGPAVASTIEHMKRDTVNNFAEAIDSFTNILTQKLPSDTITEYLEEVAYDHMMEAADKAVKEEQVDVGQEFIASSFEEILYIQRNYIDSALTIDNDTIRFKHRFQYNLDHAKTYRLIEHREEALIVLDDMTPWAWRGFHQDLIAYWLCIMQGEHDIIIGATSIDKANYPSNCEYPTPESPYAFSKKPVSDFSPRASKDEHHYKLYPNPSTSKYATLEIKLAEQQRINVEIFNLQGKGLLTPINKTLEKGSHNKKLNISSLPPGNYIVKLRMGNKLYQQILSIIK